MKKVFIIASMYCCTMGNLMAQSFPPASVADQVISTPDATRSSQMHNYSMYDRDFYGNVRNMYLTSWGGSGSAGIHWRTTKTVNTSPFVEVTDEEGYLPIASIAINMDFSWIDNLNATFIQDPPSGKYLVYATFYGYPTATSGLMQGFYLQKYVWYSGIGLVLQSQTLLDANPVMGRISMDAHKIYGIGIMWSSSGILRAKGINAGFGTVVEGPIINLPPSYKGFIPDVAFSHAGPLALKCAYVDGATERIHLLELDFLNLVSGSTSGLSLIDINTDTINTSIYTTGFTSASYVISQRMSRLILDCPDHHSVDQWAYVYNTNGNQIRSRTSDGSMVNTQALSFGSLHSPTTNNDFLSIHASDLGRVYAGWRTSNSGTTGGRFISKTYTYNASGMPPDFPRVSNINDAYSGIAFSKAESPYGFYTSFLNFDISYPMYGYQIRHKFKRYTDGMYFNDKPTAIDIHVSITPNPVKERIVIHYQGDYDAIYQCKIIDVSGRVVFKGHATMAALEQQINAQLSQWSAGYYFAQFNNADYSFNESIKMVKL